MRLYKTYLKILYLVSLIVVQCFSCSALFAGVHSSNANFSDAKNGVNMHQSRVILLDSAQSSYALNTHTAYLEYKNSQWRIEDVTSDGFMDDFVSDHEPSWSPGYTDSTYWIKIKLKAPKNALLEKKWLIEINHPLLDIAELYTRNNNDAFDRQQSDIRQTLAQREVKHVNSIFPIMLQPGETQELYFKFKNSNTFILQMTAWTVDSFREKVAKEELIYGLFYGCVLVMVIYNLFVFFAVRDMSYLYYVMYILSLVTYQTLSKPHGIILFDDDTPFWDKNYLAFSGWLSWFMAIKLYREFLNMKIEHPKLNRVLKLLSLFIVVVCGLSYVVPSRRANEVGLFMSTMLIFSTPWISYYCWKKGNDSARFFFYACLVLQCFSVLYALGTLGVIPNSMLTNMALPIGISIEVILMSFALAARIKRTQEQTLASNELAVEHLKHYQSVFDHAIEGLYQISLKDRFINANPALIRLLGYSSYDELQGVQECAMNMCFSDAKTREEIISGLQTNGAVLGLEAQYTREGGGSYWASHSAQVIFDAKGKASHIEGTLIDITERIEKEKAVFEREVAKTEQQAAKASTEAKSSFLSNMSHEIRTPLTAVIGYSESLLDAQIGKKEEGDFIAAMVKNSRHLLHVINDILDFSKIEANKLDTESIPVDMFELINEIVSTVQQLAGEKNLALDLKYLYPMPRKIMTDPTRLKQVLLSLCSNAVKFTTAGTVSITVSCDVVHQCLYIEISDTGIGIPGDLTNTLFEAFSQADTSTSRIFGGTGLGLAIAKKLAELMGGTITAKSTQGAGSQFTVSVSTGPLDQTVLIRSDAEIPVVLPKKQALNATDFVGQSLVSSIAFTNVTGTILLAEDNADNQRLITMYIEKTGAKVVIAENGEKAVKLAMETPFDLIFMDINMPLMSGLDATDMLRISGYTTPIYALTAAHDQKDIDQCMQAGCDGHLTKPIDKDVLFKTINRHLKAKV
jgi:PAS domain S-box-containing protein